MNKIRKAQRHWSVREAGIGTIGTRGKVADLDPTQIPAGGRLKDLPELRLRVMGSIGLRSYLRFFLHDRPRKSVFGMAPITHAQRPPDSRAELVTLSKVVSSYCLSSVKDSDVFLDKVTPTIDSYFS